MRAPFWSAESAEMPISNFFFDREEGEKKSVCLKNVVTPSQLGACKQSTLVDSSALAALT